MGNVLAVFFKFILGLFKASPVAPNGPYVVDCIATCFGYKDPGDDGKGAWGDDNGKITSKGVSVPIPIIKKSLGSTLKTIVKAHTVKVKANGKVFSAEITDLGPGEDGGLIWEKKNNIGHLLDLTYGACEALGLKYDANKGSFKVIYWIEDKSGRAVVIKGLDAPKHYI